MAGGEGRVAWISRTTLCPLQPSDFRFLTATLNCRPSGAPVCKGDDAQGVEDAKHARCLAVAVEVVLHVGLLASLDATADADGAV